MITLESIVESMKLQLKPHLNDDVMLYDEFIIRMIDDTRAALIRSLYISHDNLASFYQQFNGSLYAIYDGSSGEQEYLYSHVTLPTRLLDGCGRKNLQNISDGMLFFDKLDMHYCSYEEFMSYRDHVYGKNSYAVTNAGNDLFVYDANYEEVKRVMIRAIVETPSDVPGYQYTTSEYPIGAVNLRQLEIVTFQHLATKLGMPVDVINNGYDETKNANIPQRKQRASREESDEEREE